MDYHPQRVKWTLHLFSVKSSHLSLIWSHKNYWYQSVFDTCMYTHLGIVKYNKLRPSFIPFLHPTVELITLLITSNSYLKGELWHQSPWSGNNEHLFLRSSVKTVWKSDKRFKSCSQNKYLPCCPVGEAILFILPRVQHSNVVPV